MLGLAILFQLSSLYFAPIIVVQPLGAIALVITSILNSQLNHVKLNRKSIIAIVMCVGGVFLFVGVAAFTAVDKPVTDAQLVMILVHPRRRARAGRARVRILPAQRIRAIFYVIMARRAVRLRRHPREGGARAHRAGRVRMAHLHVPVGLLLATALGAYFVQNAYASGPPDLVIAGLTVVDPMVAVVIGIVVLGEASQAPLWANGVFILAGAIAVWGVFMLARNHPQTRL